MTLKEIIARGEKITEEEAIQGLRDSIEESERLKKEALERGDTEKAQEHAGYAAGCQFILTMYEKTNKGQDLEGKENEARNTFTEISKKTLGEINDT